MGKDSWKRSSAPVRIGESPPAAMATWIGENTSERPDERICPSVWLQSSCLEPEDHFRRVETQIRYRPCRLHLPLATRMRHLAQIDDKDED
jgi:hypothetical protein